MELFHFKDYRHYVTFRLSPEGGAWGSMTKLADAVGMQVSHLSQVVKGVRNLTHEQAHFLAETFGFGELETQYLAEMVNLERAASPAYRKRVAQRMRALKESSSYVVIPERNQVLFYSSWIYAGVQLATGVPGLDTPAAIADHLGIGVESVVQALKVLVEIELCGTDGKRWFPLAKKTLVDERSPLHGRHRVNWRLKGIEEIPKARKGDLFFSAAVRVDRRAYEKIARLLQDAIAEVRHSIEHAGDETLACMNLDWFALSASREGGGPGVASLH